MFEFLGRSAPSPASVLRKKLHMYCVTGIFTILLSKVNKNRDLIRKGIGEDKLSMSIKLLNLPRAVSFPIILQVHRMPMAIKAFRFDLRHNCSIRDDVFGARYLRKYHAAP